MAADEGASPVVQVVGYDDVRGVAVDAAATALQQHQNSTDEQLRQVATDAATVALEDGAQVLEGVTDGKLEKVAADAAADALQGVQVKLDEQLEQVRSAQEVEQVVTVTLDADQWQYVRDSMAMQATCSLLTLLVACMVLGTVAARHFLEGWRR